MKPRAKRLVIKTTLLALFVNTALLVVKHKQQGQLSPHDYVVAAESLGMTLALVFVLAFMLSRLGRFGKDEPR